MQFPDLNLDLVKKAIQIGLEKRADIFLFDFELNLDEINISSSKATFIDARKDDFSWIKKSSGSLVFYMCFRDDLGLNYISEFLKYNIKWDAPRGEIWFKPRGYISSNTLAADVLSKERNYQKSIGVDKWNTPDFTGIIQALDATKNMKGSYLEVGCFNGASSGAALAYAREEKFNMSFYFLDVFEGFTYDESKVSMDARWKGSHRTMGYEVIKKRLQSYLDDGTEKIVVKKSNIISDDLPENLIKEGIRVANLDVDMYEAVHSGLFKIAPHIVPGGILICEDAGHTPALIGAKFATKQFMESELGKFFTKIEMDSGQTFLIKSKTKKQIKKIFKQIEN